MYEALSTGQMLHTCEEVIAVVVMGQDGSSGGGSGNACMLPRG